MPGNRSPLPSCQHHRIATDDSDYYDGEDGNNEDDYDKDDDDDNDNSTNNNSECPPTARTPTARPLSKQQPPLATSSLSSPCWNIFKNSPVVLEVASSAEIVFVQTSHKATMLLLVLGPIAVFGDATDWLGEAACFALAGAALIPCAERLSFITEQVAEHTNGTIGALLNATFGNAPELLISVAALRSGFYRVVQLAMLGSILTNMMLVFGVACLIGGLKWQVQDLRRTSGNISVVMLLVSTAGFLLPAALLLSGQFISPSSSSSHDNNMIRDNVNYVPTDVEIRFCRVNAAILMILYVLFLVFTLGTHKDEFDDQLLLGNNNNNGKNHMERRARRNLFCLFYFQRAQTAMTMSRSRGGDGHFLSSIPSMELIPLSPGGGSSNNGNGIASPSYPKNPKKLRQQRHHGVGGRNKHNHLKSKHSERGESSDCSSEDEEEGGGGSGGVVLLQPPARHLVDLDGVRVDRHHSNSSNRQVLHYRSHSSSLGSSSSVVVRGGGSAEDNSNNNGMVGGGEGLHRQPSPRKKDRRIRLRNHHHLSPNPRPLNNGGSVRATTPSSVPLSKSASPFEPDDLLGMIDYDSEGGEDYEKDKNDNDDDLEDDDLDSSTSVTQCSDNDPLLSMRAAIFWLFILTLCISALSSIIVDSIDGFAQRMNLSEVFTSMVILPFFSNVAEQVSAFLFAYRNEMDLVVGVTIGSAIQVASFVLPGSVLIGMVMDRSMTLYFRAYETVCMLFGVIVVGAVLQGGTTNWLVGAVLVGIYIIMATGIWFHEMENLSVDGEDLIRNATLYP